MKNAYNNLSVLFLIVSLFFNVFSDEIHAYALSKALTKVSSPATVGLYSACQNRINMILEQIEGTIEQECNGRSRPRSVKPSFCDFVVLIGRLLFYKPIWTKENQQPHNVRFIYVHFSAWHFAGSDLLWAGIAMRLFQAMQLNFGKLQLVLYRLDGPNNWRSKKVCCCPLWLLVVFILMIPIIVLVVILTSDITKPEKHTNETKINVDVLDGLIIAAFGVPAASALRFTFLMCKNLFFNQDLNISKGLDNDRISRKMGFMNEVRKEMYLLTCFIQFMEVFERRRIRVVLKITHLDRCSPKKIVGVLDAINILLSDDESPFISILAVNPEVLMKKVNFADGWYCKEDRAHALLNRIVTLPFTVLPLDEFATRTHMSKLLIDKTTPALDVRDEEVEIWIRSVLTSNKRNLNKYILEDSVCMRRVFNSIRVTMIIMMALKKELPQQEYIAAWVVLANQWPCRLSWIIQCVEDAQQRADIDDRTNADDSKMLWRVFSESKAELYVMSPQIEDLLELDEDPEMFERFLTVDYQFTIKDLKTFEMATVNLDHTIRRELALIRGTSRLKDSGWMRNLAPLPLTAIINMDTEDVCKERMKYPIKYVDIVRSNGLNGSALLFGDADDLKELLGMTFGEWTSFRLHFLGLPPHLRPQDKLLPSTSHSQNQLHNFPHHVAHQYPSNYSLGKSYM
uniref:Uncharacterized protein n=1 Tax=Mola mola TaxID=94237 RepID=A0A3Q3XJT6_MOLML